MIKLYSEISEGVELVMLQLAKYEEQLSTNPAYSPEMVAKEMNNKFTLMLDTLENEAYKRYNVSKDDANASYQILQNDRDFKRATYRLRSIFAMLNGEQPEAPDVLEVVCMMWCVASRVHDDGADDEDLRRNRGQVGRDDERGDGGEAEGAGRGVDPRLGEANGDERGAAAEHHGELHAEAGRAAPGDPEEV